METRQILAALGYPNGLRNRDPDGGSHDRPAGDHRRGSDAIRYHRGGRIPQQPGVLFRGDLPAAEGLAKEKSADRARGSGGQSNIGSSPDTGDPRLVKDPRWNVSYL